MHFFFRIILCCVLYIVVVNTVNSNFEFGIRRVLSMTYFKILPTEIYCMLFCATNQLMISLFIT